MRGTLLWGLLLAQALVLAPPVWADTAGLVPPWIEPIEGETEHDLQLRQQYAARAMDAVRAEIEEGETSRYVHDPLVVDA